MNRIRAGVVPQAAPKMRFADEGFGEMYIDRIRTVNPDEQREALAKVISLAEARGKKEVA